MRKKLYYLLFSMVCSSFSGIVWGQEWTDYTDKLANPSFETGTPMSDPKSNWQTSCDGWTLAPSSAGYSQMGIVSSGATIQGVANSLTAPDGGQYFYIRNNWNNTLDFNITQTVSHESELPSGMYKITCKIITYSGNWSTSTHTLSFSEANGQTSTKTMYSTGATWTDITVLLYKASATSDLTIKANLLAGSSGGGQHYQLILDDFHLYYCSDLAATQESPVDVTDYISNPTVVSTNKTYIPRGWLAGNRSVGNTNYTSATGDNQLEAWSNKSMYFDYYQQLNGLPEGLYQLSAKCHDSNNKGGKLYATSGSTTQQVGMTTDYSTITTDKISVSDGTLRIGIKSETTSDGSWMTGDDFTLSFLGYDPTSALASLQTLYDKCNGYAEGKKMTASYATALSTALTDAKDVLDGTTAQTKANITTASTNLTNAYNDAEANVNAYTALNTAITTYDALSESLGSTYKSAYDIATADIKTAYTDATYTTDEANVAATDVATAYNTQREAENVDGYNNITTGFTYSYESVLNPDLTKWTTDDFVTMTADEHWNGEKNQKYYEQSTAEWSQTSWSHNASQTVVLPKGDYAMVISARASNDVTSSMSVKVGEAEAVTVILPHKGASGKGIATDGTATYSAEATYANSDNGFGWEYRYITFSTTKDNESVTISFNASANSVHQWVSIANPLLRGSVHPNQIYVNKAKSLADELKTYNGLVYTGLYDSFSTDLTNADNATVESKGLETLVTTLNTDIDKAKASKSIYDAIGSAITATQAKADALDSDGQDKYTELTEETVQSCADKTIDTGIDNIQTTTIASLNTAFVAAVKAQTSDDAVFTYALVNPSFEDGKDVGWTFVQNLSGWQDVSIKTENPADGTNLINAWAGQFNYCNIWQKLTLPAGKYTLSAKARTDKQPLPDQTQVRTYNSGKLWSASAGLTYTADETAWNDVSKWITLSTTFYLSEDTEIELGIYSQGRNEYGNQQGWYQVDDFRLIRNGASPTANMTISASNQWATFYAPFAVDIPQNVYSYAITADGNNVSRCKIGGDEAYTLPAETPVLVYTDNEEGYTNTFVAGSASSNPGALDVANCLVGTDVALNPVPATTNENVNYILQKGETTVAWFQVIENSNTLPANRAYLSVSDGTSVKGILDFDDVTAIKTFSGSSLSNQQQAYNLAGQHVGRDYKGIVIVNGKKVINK